MTPLQKAAQELISELQRIANEGMADYANTGYPNSNAIRKAAEMLESFVQDFETYSCIIKSATARERNTRETLRKVLEGRKAQQVAVPAGYALVPIEPTPAILDAMSSSGWKTACYKAMLAAAQEAKQ